MAPDPLAPSRFSLSAYISGQILSLELLPPCLQQVTPKRRRRIAARLAPSAGDARRRGLSHATPGHKSLAWRAAWCQRVGITAPGRAKKTIEKQPQTASLRRTCWDQSTV